MKKIFTLILGVILVYSNSTIAHDSLAKAQTIEVKQKIWATIFASYYTTVKGEYKPKSAFEMPTALFGYSATFSDKLKATLIYDVTRTTNAIKVTEESGDPMEGA